MNRPEALNEDDEPTEAYQAWFARWTRLLALPVMRGKTTWSVRSLGQTVEAGLQSKTRLEGSTTATPTAAEMGVEPTTEGPPTTEPTAAAMGVDSTPEEPTTAVEERTEAAQPAAAERTTSISAETENQEKEKRKRERWRHAKEQAVEQYVLVASRPPLKVFEDDGRQETAEMTQWRTTMRHHRRLLRNLAIVELEPIPLTKVEQRMTAAGVSALDKHLVEGEDPTTEPTPGTVAGTTAPASSATTAGATAPASSATTVETNAEGTEGGLGATATNNKAVPEPSGEGPTAEAAPGPADTGTTDGSTGDPTSADDDDGWGGWNSAGRQGWTHRWNWDDWTTGQDRGWRRHRDG